MAPTPKKKAAKRTATAGKKSGARAADEVAPVERIDQMIAGLDDWRGAMLAEIRGLIHEAVPEVVEEWKWMGSPVWTCSGNFLVGNAHKEKVKLTFPHGAELPDPKGVFNAGLDGNKWRAIDLKEGEALNRSGFKTLLRAAVALNKAKAAAKTKRS